MAKKAYKSWNDLPGWATTRIRVFRPNDAETSIYTPVPALGNQSFIDVMNQGSGGITQARNYLNQVLSKFFPEKYVELGGL